jgi:hypothetical protein
MTIREATDAEIQITTPLTSRSGCWEVSTASGTAFYDDFDLVVSFLAKFEEIESSDADPRRAWWWRRLVCRYHRRPTSSAGVQAQ